MVTHKDGVRATGYLAAMVIARLRTLRVTPASDSVLCEVIVEK
jgi:hypothetical protein